MLHIKEHYPKKKEAVAFITDYLMHPSADKALCASIDIRYHALYERTYESTRSTCCFRDDL